jgi:hypothetical protein
MSKTIAAFIALLDALSADLQALNNGSSPSPTDGGEPTPDKPKRGRPSKGTPPAETPADPTETPAAAKDDDGTMTFEQLQEVSMPLVKAGKGRQVKAIIEKYAGEGKAIRDVANLAADKQAAYIADIEALSIAG